MKAIVCGFLALVLLCGCSSVNARKREMSAAFTSLSPAEQEAVQPGRVENGMSTNAVYIAWGAPSAVLPQPTAAGGIPDETWLYYGDRPVLVPAWTYLPDPNGYWRLEYSPEHYSARYTKAEVRFHNGRVTDATRY